MVTYNIMTMIGAGRVTTCTHLCEMSISLFIKRAVEPVHSLLPPPFTQALSTQKRMGHATDYLNWEWQAFPSAFSNPNLETLRAGLPLLGVRN